jgi:peptide/nickel transport system permease protein
MGLSCGCPTALAASWAAVWLLAPWLAPGDPAVGSVLKRLKPIGTPGHPLGTD